MSEKTRILNKEQIETTINRIAYQIYEDCSGEDSVILAGVKPNGIELSARLKKKLEEISHIKATLLEIELDKKNPLGGKINVNADENLLKDKVIILVDDVLNSGKTLIYSLSPFLKFPIKKLRTVLLVDRNHKTYPIAADFVGISLATTMMEHITVKLSKEEEAVYLS